MQDADTLAIGLARSQFKMFVAYAFKRTHGERLGDQPYITHMCHMIERLIAGQSKRVLINLPPQHLKSFVGTICLAAYLLGHQPRLRILLVAYNDDFAANLCDRIRSLMHTPWYRSMFTTRIKDGHSRHNDFQTTDGGGVFAVSATGAVTGRTADVVIYDDPHEISDWNNERKLTLVRQNFNTILSRLHNKRDGTVLVIAHRVSTNDLSAMLHDESGWTSVRLPLIAVRRRSYELGHDTWIRSKGDVLRPDAYPKKEIDRLQRTQVSPPFDLFYQQGLDSRSSPTPRETDFGSYERYLAPIAPIVLSVDPGHLGSANSSRSAIQAWKFATRKYYLIDQFCDQCDFEQLKSEFWRFVRRHNPSVALIEKTANGPALYSAIRKKARFRIELIVPRDAKAVRLGKHAGKIRAKKILLPADASWRQSFVDELVSFPGEHDDQVDALTQYLDFMDTNPIIAEPQPRGLGAVSTASGRW